MNKRGSVKRLMFEIAYISFAVLIGLSVLVYVYSLTNDTTLKAKIYAEDIANTINSMNNAKAFKIKVTYELPEVYKFNLDQEYVYVNDKEIQIKIKYRLGGYFKRGFLVHFFLLLNYLYFL